MADDPWAKYRAGTPSTPSVPAPQRGPVVGPLPVPKQAPLPTPPTQHQVAKDTWRDMTPEEIAAGGLDPTQVWQISGTGEKKALGKAGRTQAFADTARYIVDTYGVDLTPNGADQISDLIKSSTSGKLESFGAGLYGNVTGDATSGMESIGKLQAIANRLVLDMMPNGSLGAQISNTDRDFIAASLGDIGNPDKPWNQRLAAWEQVKQRLARALGAPAPDRDAIAGAAPPAGGGQGGNGPSGGTIIPEMIGDVPKGTEVESATAEMMRGGSWSRGEFLDNLLGGNGANKEAAIVAFWNANFKNPGLTERGVIDFYKSQNIPLPDDVGAAVKEAQTGQRADGTPFNGYQPFDLSDEEKRAKAVMDAEIKARGIDPEHGGRAFTGHVLEGASMGFGDELMGVAAGAGALAQGENPIDAYQSERDITRRKLERSAAAHPKTAFASEIMGGLATGPVGFRKAGMTAAEAKVARAASRAAPGSASLAATARSARNVALGEAAKGGARMGAVAGYGYGEGPVGSAAGAGLGGAAGAVIAPAMAAIAPRVGDIVSKIRPQRETNAFDQAVVEAGARRGVPIRQPDARPELGPEYGRVSRTDAGRPITEAAGAEDVAAIEGAIARDVGGGRQAVEQETMGRNMAKALFTQKSDSKDVIGAIYTKAKKLSRNFQEKSRTATNYLNSQIAVLEEKGLTDRARVIAGLRDHLDKNGLSIDSIQGMREKVRDLTAASGLMRGQEEAIAKKAQQIAGNALAAAMEARGLGGAAKLLRDANARNAAQHDFVEQITEELLGKDGKNGAGQILTTVKGWAQGDHARLERMLAGVDKNTRRDLAAHIAAGIGKDSAGNFNWQQFIRHTVGEPGAAKPLLSPSAQRLLFGEEGVRAIADLRTIVAAKQATAKGGMAGGPSQGAVGRGFRTMLFTMFGGTAGTAVGGPWGAAAGGAVGAGASKALSRIGDARAARMLMNPDFTKLLKTAPETSNPAAINKWFATLERVAAQSPVLAADVEALKQAMLEEARARNKGGKAEVPR